MLQFFFLSADTHAWCFLYYLSLFLFTYVWMFQCFIYRNFKAENENEKCLSCICRNLILPKDLFFYLPPKHNFHLHLVYMKVRENVLILVMAMAMAKAKAGVEFTLFLFSRLLLFVSFDLIFCSNAIERDWYIFFLTIYNICLIHFSNLSVIYCIYQQWIMLSVDFYTWITFCNLKIQTETQSNRWNEKWQIKNRLHDCKV